MGLVLLDLILALFGITVVIGTVYGLRKGPLKGFANKLQGKRNAKRLISRDMVCAYCNEQVHPEIDLYLGNQWWHTICYKKVIDEIP